MKKIILGLLLTLTAYAGAQRVVTVDQFQSSDLTKQWTPPATSDTLTGNAATQSLTNKTINGASNSITNLPPSAIAGGALSGVNTGDVTLGVSSGLSIAGQVLSMDLSSATTTGSLTAQDWNIFNNKGSGAVTSVTASAPILSSGGATPVISIPAADSVTDGFLSAVNWNTFNNKVTSVTGSAPVVSSGGSNPAISMASASTSVDGYLTSTDWNIFNNKQATGLTWLLSGNAGTTPGTDFIGTTDANDLVFKTSGSELMRLDNSNRNLSITGGIVSSKSVTDSGVSGDIIGITSHTTVDGSNTLIGINGNATEVVDAGVTNDKSVSGMNFVVTRGDGSDDGTLHEMDGLNVLGFLNSGAAGLTDVGYGISNILFTSKGTLTNYYDFRSQIVPSGTGTITNHYGLYLDYDSASPQKNWLSGSTQMGGTSFLAPDSPLVVHGDLGMQQVATPANPAASYNKLYFKSDDNLYMLNSAGMETQVNNTAAPWLLGGNAGTSPGTDFIGTTDAQDLEIKTNGAEVVRVTSGGNVGIGNSNPGAKLDVVYTESGAVANTTGIGSSTTAGAGSVISGLIGSASSVNIDAAANVTTSVGNSTSVAGNSAMSLGYYINMGSATQTNGLSPTGLQIINGKTNITTTEPIGSSLFLSNTNFVSTTNTIGSGSPVTGTSFIANENGANLHADDNFASGPLGFGWLGEFFGGDVSVKTTKTVADATEVFATAFIPASSNGGTVTNLSVFRTTGPINQGGSLNIGNLFGYRVDSGFSSSATSAWGFYIDDTGSENFLSKLAIGTSSKKVANSSTALEIGNSKAFLNGSGSTATKNALTALAGMQFYDTDLGMLQFYDGSSWVSTGGGGGSATAIQETPSGAVDNSNDTFTLSQTPTAAASVVVSLDGLVQEQGVDYTISGVTLTMATAPVFGQKIYATYNY